MKSTVRSGLLIALCLIILTGFGCAKKKIDENTPPASDASDGGGYGNEVFGSEENQAVSQISNGVVYFAYDSFELRADSKAVLSQKASIMKQYPQLRVVIEGHCDERGTEEYNLALGERRARAAYDYLVNLGVKASQMDMVSFGKLHPATDGSGENSWSQNRRDEFKVTKTTY